MISTIVDVLTTVANFLIQFFQKPKVDNDIKNEAALEASHVEDVKEIVRGVDADRASKLLSSFPGDKVRKAKPAKTKPNRS